MYGVQQKAISEDSTKVSKQLPIIWELLVTNTTLMKKLNYIFAIIFSVTIFLSFTNISYANISQTDYSNYRSSPAYVNGYEQTLGHLTGTSITSVTLISKSRD